MKSETNGMAAEEEPMKKYEDRNVAGGDWQQFMIS